MVITRAAHQAAPLVTLLEGRGAVPILFPTIAVELTASVALLDAALQQLDRFSWLVVTSVHGSELVLERGRSLGLPRGQLQAVRVAAVGRATAEPFTEAGATVALQPAIARADVLAEELLKRMTGSRERVLLVQSALADPTLEQQLTAYGCNVTVIHPYTSVLSSPDPAAWAALRAGVDAVLFTSASTVTHLLALLGEEWGAILDEAVMICIGPSTARAVREHGLTVHGVAREQS
ncbi:MAG: uroporphyrinogen-III synthase, partial [Chloroflexi bacterium]|nr:uroporphyrinogen-III synthase [Chloroflexota bacterium]